MPAIMCSKRLWTIVRSWNLELPESDVISATTGPWAATLCRDVSRELIIAIDSSTYLTIVFPLTSAAEFHRECARALGAILEDIGVRADRVAVETTAMALAPLVRLTDGSLREPLQRMEFMCGVELNYHSDLRRVQISLSEYPHAPSPHYVPIAAARSAFGVPVRSTTDGGSDSPF